MAEKKAPKQTTVNVNVPAEEKEWHEKQARQAGLTISDWVRNLLLEKRLAVELAPPPEPAKKLTRREQYLEEIRRTGAPIQAGQRLGIKASEVREWAKNPDFPREVALAKAAWLESLEQDMVKIGRGRMKGDTQAIGWILNAHHPNHGRAKKELLLSMINPLIKRLAEFLVMEFGGDARDRVKKALEQFQMEVRKKLVGMA